MAFQLDYLTRNQMAAQLQSTVGASGVLKLFAGAEPVNCAASDPASGLCTIALPAVFMSISSGVTAISGAWAGTTTASGVVQSFRMYDASSNCRAQGDTSTVLILSTGNGVVSGQAISVVGFNLTIGGA